jgi:hypothetical protein
VRTAAADPALAAALLEEVEWIDGLPQLLPPELSQAYWAGVPSEALVFLKHLLRTHVPVPDVPSDALDSFEELLRAPASARMIPMLAEVGVWRQSAQVQTEGVLGVVAGGDFAAAAALAVTCSGGRAAVERLFVERPSVALRLCLCIPPDAVCDLNLGSIAALIVGGDLPDLSGPALQALVGARPPGWAFVGALANRAGDFEVLLDAGRAADAFALIGCARPSDDAMLTVASARLAKGDWGTALQLAEVCGWFRAGGLVCVTRACGCRARLFSAHELQRFQFLRNVIRFFIHF